MQTCAIDVTDAPNVANVGDEVTSADAPVGGAPGFGAGLRGLKWISHKGRKGHEEFLNHEKLHYIIFPWQINFFVPLCG